MARLWSSGFELQSATNGVEWYNANSTMPAASISTTTKRSGAAALRVSSLTSGARQAVNQRLTSAANVANGTGAYARVYLYIATLPSADNTIFGFGGLDTDLRGARVVLTSTGALKVVVNTDATQIGSNSSALSTGQWYRVELYQKRDGTTPNSGADAVELKIDGTTVASSTTASIVDTGAVRTLVLGGNLAEEAQTQGEWFFDDVALNDSTGSDQASWPGDGRIVHLDVAGAGEFAQTLTIATGEASAWQTLDEAGAPDDATSYLTVTDNTTSWTSAGSRGMFACANLPETPDSVTLVSVGGRYSTGSTSGSQIAIGLQTADGGTVLASSAFAVQTTDWITNILSTTARAYQLTAYTDPSSSAWAESTVNSLQIGVRGTDASPDVHVSKLWALVEYVVSGASTEDGAGTSAAVGAASAVGACIAATVGVAAAVAAAAGITLGVEAGAGTAAASGAASAVGASIAAAVGSVAGAAPSWTLVALPDTQYYSETDALIDRFTDQTAWVVAQRATLNIAFVIHEGDVVENATTAAEWVRARTALDTLYDEGIPHGFAFGNHDDQGLALTYLPASRFEGFSWWGGSLEGAYDTYNNYQLFDVSGQSYVVVHVTYQPNLADMAAAVGLDDEVGDTGAVPTIKAVARWVDGVLTTHASRQAIVVFHQYLDGSGERVTGADYWWTYVLEPHSNVRLVFNGHELGAQAEALRSEVASDGRTVHQMLANYQSRTNGGNGWLRVLTCSPADRTIEVATYSPTLDQNETDANSAFTLDAPWLAVGGLAGAEGVAASIASAAGTATGSAAGTGTAASTGVASGTSGGTASAAGVSDSLGTSDAAGTAAAVASATGIGASSAASAGTSATPASAAGTGSALAASAGASAGVAAAVGVGDSLGTGEAAGAAAGVANATGVGASTAATTGVCAATASASGVGTATTASVGAASATASAAAVGESVTSGANIGTATAMSTASGIGGSTATSAGTASATASASAVGALANVTPRRLPAQAASRTRLRTPGSRTQIRLPASRTRTKIPASEN